MGQIGISGGWLYLLIFVGKMIEVTFSTLRIMFVGKGKKFLGAFCGLFEVFFWVVIASSVLADLYEDPFEVVVYCVAFSCGILMGMALEQRLAVGLTSIQVVSPATDAEKVGATLREGGFGVTLLDGHSVDGTKREMIFVQLKRKRIPEAVKLVRAIDPDAIISANDVKSLGGGFMR
ncbi:MAG: DUF2179 domain-containing protein [Oscillospiraceae bacterium]